MFLLSGETPYLCIDILIIKVMKTIEELKKEQAETKSKLVDVIETINSEEYYTLTPSEKGLIAQQRVGLEIYLDSLTKQLYDKDGCLFDVSNTMWPLLMSSMLTSPLSTPLNTDALKKDLSEKDFEIKEETDESGHDD